jgi:hypothetical protein
MRWFGRFLMLALMLALTIVAGRSVWDVARRWTEATEDAGDRFADANTSVIYPLDAEEWTHFPFSNPPSAVRIVSHADVPAETLEVPDTRWRYAVAVQVLGRSGAVIRETVQHFRTRVIAYRDTNTGEAFTATAYADGTVVPTAADAVALDLSDLEQPTAIRARIASTDPGIRSVALRVYERQPATERRLSVGWQRLSAEDRAYLAQGNVFPPERLSADERINALRNRWTPIGPSGVEGRDYRAQTLYALGGIKQPRIEPQALPPGVYADAHHRVTIPLPEQGGRIRLAIQPVGDIRRGELAVNWYGQGLAERSSHSFAWNQPEISPETSPETSVEATFGGGLLEIASDQPVTLRAYLQGGETEEEITQVGDQVRTFSILPDQDLTYPVLHVGDEPTPFRISFRCLCFDVEGLLIHRPDIRFKLVDNRGVVLEEGVVPLAPQPSLYDHPAGDLTGLVSDPVSVHFNLPPGTSRLILSAGAPVLATASSHPPGTEREFLVPEDSFAPHADAGRRATWFSVRPENWENLVSANRAVMITVPQRPPEVDPEIAAGLYEWEQFTPEGSWLARDLLVPRNSSPARQQALSAIYTPIPTDETVALVFTLPVQVPTVQPELIYLRQGTGPLTIRGTVDGRELFRQTVGATRGTIPLPAFAAGRHDIRITTSQAAEILINQVAPGPGSVIRRRALRLAAGETWFEIEKKSADPEIVAAHLFPQSGGEQRQIVRVAIEGGEQTIGPLEDWTIRQREYSVRIGPEEPDVRVLGAEQTVGPERTLFLPLGSDLPAGRYRLRFTLPHGPEAYLALTRTTPGLEARREVLQEREENETSAAR